MQEFDREEQEVVVKKTNKVADYVQEVFTKAETSKFPEEERMITAYRNYRGLYGPDIQFTEAERCQVFVKVTKTKVIAAAGQLTDVTRGDS